MCKGSRISGASPFRSGTPVPGKVWFEFGGVEEAMVGYASEGLEQGIPIETGDQGFTAK